uniref:T9SS type A sorting domain-containing protein n=1 Tax=Eiseniibacteriota bacterium TaxID=2212470 RepID=A0A832MMV4_UNCEI
MRRGLAAAALAGALLAVASVAHAQRPDVIWARTTNGAPITLDGVLSEPAWAFAESVIVQWGVDAGIPGSGYRAEGGTLPSDPTWAKLKFLSDGNQIYMAAQVLDQSIGGDPTFNRFDGFLMAIKDHAAGFYPAPPAEYFYSMWWPNLSSPIPPGTGFNFIGRWGVFPPGTPRTPEQIANWDAATVVTGLTASDAQLDQGYVTEMRFNLTPMGYDITDADGDVVEWNISVYDCDWFWPIIPPFSANRTWWQGPWGNASVYNEVRIYGRPDVTITSGPVPAVDYEFRIPNAGAAAAPVIDGVLDDAVWALAPSFDMRYGDDVLRQSYPGVLRWRAGQYQPPVNGGVAAVLDPADATIKYFFKGTKLYIGADVRDQVVQSIADFNRWDGLMVSLNERRLRNVDSVLIGRRLSVKVGPTGQAQTEDYLTFLRDSLGGAQVALALKPGTTVDTLGLDTDTGYQIELEVDLTKLGYTPDLGDHLIFMGLNLLDGDSFTPFTDSYGSRTWWAREYENTCCPPWALLDESLTLVDVAGGGPAPSQLALLGNHPNPFRRSTTLRFAVPSMARVSLQLFDVQGRVVQERDLGLVAPGEQRVTLQRDGLANGLYFYRLRTADPLTGAARETRTGRMMVLE